MDACNKVSHGVEVCVNTTPVQSMEKQSVAIEGTEEPPEALGSVTLSQEGEGSSTGLQTRSSARVSKKMRLDSIGTPVAEKREPASETEKPETKPPPEVVKPKRRPWELWSIEDKNTFFEALNEFGKDFDAIQNHFATKARRKGVPEDMIKNKDQIRHFYYRTWHKISKHLKFNDDTKKATQELYALINYGELRKKLGCVSEKTCLKLNELIYKGSTQIRIRGKTLRIKTPICRALRKLNQLEDLQEELKLPSRVFVEMRPRYMEAWCRVQAASQNPCLRTLLPLQRRLTSLLAFLQQRWRPSHVKHRDKLLNSVNAGDLDHELEDYRKEKEPLLRVAPRPNVEIELPTLNLTEYLTSSSLCLSAHEERIARGETAGPTRGGAKGCASKKGGKRQRNESAGEKKVPDVVVKSKEAVSSEGEVVNCAKAPEVTNCNSPCDNADKTVDMLVSSTVCVGGSDGDDLVPAEFNIHQIFSLQDEPANGLENIATATVSSSLAEPLEPAKAEVEPPAAPPSLPLPPRLEDPEEILARIRRGWTIEEAHAVTIGELYLMFGANSKVQLEYWWEEEVKPKSPLPEGDEELSVSPVATVLQKLVSIAKLNYRKAKLVCPCGHICGAPNKSTVSSRNKVPPKVKLGATSTEKNGSDATSADPGSTQTFVGPKKRLLGNKVAAPVLHDGVFRRPLLAPSQYKTSPKVGATDAFKAQLDKFRPRYCNRRGRSVRPKGVVVQRMLPLLPKAPNGHAMVTLKVIPQTSQLSGEFMPIGTSPGSVINLAPARPTPCSKPPEVLPAPQPGGLLLNDPSPAPLHGTWHQPQSEPMNIDNPTPQPVAQPPAAPESSSSSPPPCPVETVVNAPHTSPPPMSPAPSITHLLELELNSAAGDDISLGGVSNGLLDVSLPATNTPTTNFVGLLASDGIIQHQNTPPSSPSRILKENDNQWLNSEVADFSLSSFLNHLESPLKPTAAVASAPSGDDTRLSSDVEAQLQCLMSENSVDYMAKFADLAAQIAADGANKK
ncbi:protein cramped [Anabrus simplex]|uniref:protein cramped n=1 Tax=Anabrus simplex TaxID=316456 RepID=UPI0035A296E4